MKQKRSMTKRASTALLAGILMSSVSCMTTYDTYGRPVQSVDPGLAAVGIVGAGLVGAAIASSSNDTPHKTHHRKHHHPPHHASYHPVQPCPHSGRYIPHY